MSWDIRGNHCVTIAQQIVVKTRKKKREEDLYCGCTTAKKMKLTKAEVVYKQCGASTKTRSQARCKC